MSAKIFILCAFFGAVSAKDTNEGRILDLMTTINEDIKFVIGQSFQLTGMYTNVSQILEIKIGTIYRLKSSLLTSIDQIEALMKAKKMDGRGLVNGSNFIMEISGSVFNCIQLLLKNLSLNFERSKKMFSVSAGNLESIKSNLKNAHRKDFMHELLRVTNVKRQKIMNDLETFVNLHLGAVERMTLEFDNTPVYANCLIDNSVVQTIKSLDAFCLDVKGICDYTIAGEVDNEMKSAMEKIFDELNDNVGNLENQIKTWDPVKGPFRQALPNYYYRTT